MDQKQVKFTSFAALALPALLILAVADPAAALEPVSLESGANAITLSVAGTYRGGFFSNNTPASPPGYDAGSKRLFVGSVDRQGIDVIDISVPTLPRLLRTIDIRDHGTEPNSVAVHKGVVAVTVKTKGEPPAPSRVLLYNAEGVLVGGPVDVPDAGRIFFAPNGKSLVVTISGSLSEDCLEDPEGQVAVIDLGSVNWGGCRQGPETCNIRLAEPRLADFRAFEKQREALIEGGARFYGLNVLDPSKPIPVAQDVNPEGLTISADSRFAWVTLERNNAIAKVDLKSAKVVAIYPLGSQDHSRTGHGFDASDKDGGVNIKPWPVRSFYSPDGIAAVGGGRQTYLITADEGDPKDGECGYGEKVRLKSLTLDPTAFPGGADLKNDANLGRLNVTNADGDTDGDSDFDEIYMLGSRSFSVWTAEGKVVFNSGDAFERITAQAVPAFFNTGEDENNLDARSDDRGPEPEHLTVGTVNGRDYLFVGFERIGGLVVYDITKPTKPVFQQYINNRNFALDPKKECGTKGSPELPTCAAVGDLEPEGFVFIPKQDSPIDVPLLAVIHELSDSTTVYRIDSRSGD